MIQLQVYNFKIYKHHIKKQIKTKNNARQGEGGWTGLECDQGEGSWRRSIFQMFGPCQESEGPSSNVEEVLVNC